MRQINISSLVKVKGLEIQVDKRKYDLHYPKEVWQRFPSTLKEQYAQNVCFFLTYHLVFRKIKLNYQFPPPVLAPLFLFGLLNTLPEAIFEFPNKKFTLSQLLDLLYESNFLINFTGIAKPLLSDFSFTFDDGNNALIPFSFGKDSLLTYALCRELGMERTLLFFLEDGSLNEIINKKKLMYSFSKDFNDKINFVDLTGINLKENEGTKWGWDLLVTQYTLLSIPYVFSTRAKYLFWSNEQNTNSVFSYKGHPINLNYEQSARWMQFLNQVFRIFHFDTYLGSLVEPLYELLDFYVLHHRYPDIGRYQLTCDNEYRNTRDRWCGNCSDCARMYIYFLAFGIDPERVNFTAKMLDIKNKRLFDIFTSNRKYNTVYQQYADDRLLAFYLAYKRGVKGDLIDIFKNMYRREIEKNTHRLYEKLVSLNSSITVPLALKPKVMNIFQEELEILKKEIKRLL